VKNLILLGAFVVFCYLAFTAFDMGEMTQALVWFGGAIAVAIPFAAKSKDKAKAGAGSR
jgi:hypothetical protein